MKSPQQIAARIIERLLERGYNPDSLYKVAMMLQLGTAGYKEVILDRVPDDLKEQVASEIVHLIKELNDD